MTILDLAKDFSCLEPAVDGKRLTYLDAAASTPSPDAVLAQEADARRFTFANVHRGQHALADAATEAYANARRRVARFLQTDAQSIVFTTGTTASINLVAAGLRGSRPGPVLSTLGEHHSNLTPWQRHHQVAILAHDPRFPLDPDALTQALERHRPTLFAFQHASNVTGVIHPAAELCRVARDHGVMTLVDAAQSAPHLPLNVNELGCDFLAFSGHKLLGPKGIGVLFGRQELLSRLEPLCVGGGSVRDVSEQGFASLPSPEGLEAGTPNVIGAIGMAAALDYLDGIGMAAVRDHGASLARELRALTEALPGVELLCGVAEETLPLVSFIPKRGGISANQLATFLSDSAGVMVRSGQLCAHPAFESWGAPSGALRVSAHVYNDSRDLRTFAASAQRFLERLT